MVTQYFNIFRATERHLPYTGSHSPTRRFWNVSQVGRYSKA